MKVLAWLGVTKSYSKERNFIKCLNVVMYEVRLTFSRKPHLIVDEGGVRENIQGHR